ncbi:MAG: hypothetical protein CXR31_04945 [Geobacter sp.]|nr:MAG: hypothetical protein CXR31_04945 [Geobacter sp.]
MTLGDRQPLVSIITPAYNRANLLEETIESILSQDYPNLEYIVLDDGSTDATLEVIKRYEGRLRWDSHPNMGETLTVNKGFSMTGGEIVGVVNSDDPLLPGAITRIVRALLARPNAVVAYPDWQLIDEHGAALQVVMCRDFVSTADMVRGHYCLPGPGAFCRRSVIEGTGGRDPSFRYVGDFDFWLRAGLIGDFVRIPEVLATFRTHAGSATVSSQSTDMANEHIRVIEKVFDGCKVRNDLEQIRAESLLNAYHAAVCFSGKRNFFRKIRYMLRSISYSPGKFVLKYQYRLLIYACLSVGIRYDLIYYKCRKIFNTGKRLCG